MTALLVTRLDGRRACMQLVRSGAGPMVWAGELRLGHPVQYHRTGPAVYPVTVGAGDAAGLLDVLDVLTIQARELKRDQRTG